MVYIFISYANDDQERVKPLLKLLKSQGWSVWWDHCILPGMKFDDVIEQALDHAKCIVVVWSKHSVSSNWVRAEASEANQRRVLIPVLLDNVPVPGLDHRIGHFMLFEVDSEARVPAPLSPISRQTSSAASVRKSVLLPSCRQAG